MNKFDLKTLSSALSKAHNISEADAEQFLKIAVSVIKDALLTDGQVKIKGLGTFKLIGMPERELIDVNSGERITVEARSRISFSPDSVLRDIINKPFIFFDTIALRDGVTFDDEADAEQADEDDEAEDSRLACDDDDASEEDESEELGDDAAEDNDEHIDSDNITIPSEDDEETPAAETAGEEINIESPAEIHPETEEDDTETSDDSAASNDAPNEEETEDSEHLSEASVEAADDSRDEIAIPAPLNDAEEIKTDSSDGETGSSPEQADEDDDEDEDEEDEKHSENKIRKKIWILFLIIVIFVAAAGFLFGLYAGGGSFSWLKGSSEAVADTAQDTPASLPVTADTIASDSITAAEALKADSIARQDSIARLDSIQKAAAEKAFDTLYYDSIDVRVRTGAYHIVGIADTVVVIQGQTLKSITKAYLGEGMECYVEALNGVTSVSAGDTLKIPELKWKRKRRR